MAKASLCRHRIYKTAVGGEGLSTLSEGSLTTAAKKIGCSRETYLSNRTDWLKWCWSCGEWHEKGRFGRDSSRSDELASICREAASRKQKQGYTPKPRPECGRRRKEARDGDKRQANSRVNYLVSIGKLPDPSSIPCSDCNHVGMDVDHEYDHFLGYSAEHQEHVQAVCTKCHGIRTVGRGERPKPPTKIRSERCQNGHFIQESLDGQRRCRECQREYYQRYYKKRKKPRISMR